MKNLKRDALLMKLGAARQQSPAAWRLVALRAPKAGEEINEQTFLFRLRKDKLRQVRRREGRYLLRTNLTEADPAQLWQQYIQLTQIEEAFKNLKGDLAIRPIYHRLESRIEAHIFVSFLAYCVHVSLREKLRRRAPGLTPRSVLENLRPSNARRALSDYRRARVNFQPLHPTRSGPKNPAQPAQSHSARTISSTHQCVAPTGNVGQTF
jgi:hypothetical protein